jgi:hypothetical protein
LDAEGQAHLQGAVPDMPLTFLEIAFVVPDNLQPFTLPDRLPCSPHSSTMGYRHMIRFHATVIHEYLFNPSNGYSHVEFMLRLDDDSSFNSPIGYDLFVLMRENQLDFGFVNTVQDDEKCVHGLWNHTKQFLHQAPARLVNSKNKKEFLKWKEGLVIYNNFELSRVSIWKTQLWQQYMASIDRSGGIYLKRWGDAPIHTIYALLGIPLARLHAFVDIAYRHDPFVNQTASGLPRPMPVNPFSLNHTCVYYDAWRCGNSTNSSNTTREVVPNGPLHPQWSPDIPTSTFIATKALATNKPSRQVVPLQYIAFGKKVIYTFAHFDRWRLLAGIGACWLVVLC